MECKLGFFVDDNTIKYREQMRGGYRDKVIIPKDIFVDAYNKWIANANNKSYDWDDCEWMNDN